jgi:hypothetical protein
VFKIRWRGGVGRAARPTGWGPAAAAGPGSRPAALATIESARRILGPPHQRRALAAAAWEQIAPGLEPAFRGYVEWLVRRGYGFGSCEDLPQDFGESRVYLRYDVHIRDLFGAFALADLHQRLRIPGSFQLCWEYSRSESEISDLFLKLSEFDNRYVQFGLHCSPETGWLIADRFGGRTEGLDNFVRTGGGRGLIAEWLAAYQEDGPEAPALTAARARADAHLNATAASFRRHFGPVATVSGHGTALAALYLDAVRNDLRLSPLAPYFHSVEFLDPNRVRRHGFARELTRFEGDDRGGPVIMFENPVADMAQRYAERLAGGGGFVVLFHPATWTGDGLAPFLDGLPAAD